MRQALEMALESLGESQQILDEYATEFIFTRQKNNDAIATIKEALTQLETPYEIGQRIAKTGGGISHLWSAVLNDGEIAEAERGFKEALAQPEQEPVAWMSKEADIVYTSIQVDGCFQHDHIPLYTTPPQRTWVGLTDEEFNKVCSENHPLDGLRTFVQAIETTLRSKNT